MKKLFAVLLACMMLLSAASAENAFVDGLEELMQSIRLDRDMVTLRVRADEEFTLRIRAVDEVGDISLEAAGQKVRLQASGEEAYLAVGEQALHLRFADLTAFAPRMPEVDEEALSELFQMVVMKLLMPFAEISGNDGVHVKYRAEGRDLLANGAEILDKVVTDDRYAPLVDQVLGFLEQASGQKLPNREQLKEIWPQLREKLVSQEADFHIAFTLDADRRMSEIRITGEVGPEADLLMMNWEILSDRDRVSLTGKLTERRKLGEETRDFDIDIQGEYNRGVWSLDITYPSRLLHLKAEGSHEDEIGRFSVTRESTRNPVPDFQLQGTYYLEDETISCMAHVTDRRNQVSWTASFTAGENILDLKISDMTGRAGFALKLLRDHDALAWGSLESVQHGEVTRFVYDGEKLNIVTPGLHATVTGEMESDHAYVITVHPENLQDSRDAHARLEYSGEEGNFGVTGSVTNPDGQEELSVQFVCEPTDGIPDRISDWDNILELTPEVIMSLMAR